MDNNLYSANDLAKQLLPGSDFDAANAFAISHVSAAIENLAEWKSLNSTSARIDLEAIVREVREMNESGFLVAEKLEAPFTCKYCGLPSWIAPSDQSPLADYCHEIDHGTVEDRAVFGSDSAEP
jgi:hypothetical protein